MPVSDPISGCSDVGFSAYFICHSASSSQKLKSLAFPFFHLFLSFEEIKCPSVSYQDSSSQAASWLELGNPTGQLLRTDNDVAQDCLSASAWRLWIETAELIQPCEDLSPCSTLSSFFTSRILTFPLYKMTVTVTQYRKRKENPCNHAHSACLFKIPKKWLLSLLSLYTIISL